MGGSRNSCNGTKYNAIEHIFMESKAYKICERWAIQQGDATFSIDATWMNESWKIYFLSCH